MEQQDGRDAAPQGLATDRRDRSRKLVSETKLVWTRHRSRLPRRGKGDVLTVFDLSANGARVVGPHDTTIRVGTLVEVVVEGHKGLVEVRWIEPLTMNAAQSSYGLRFVSNGDELRDAIQRRLDEEQSAFEWVWEHLTK
jgi:PilZ domain-containing protein